MKKILSVVLLAALVVLTFAGCGGGKDPVLTVDGTELIIGETTLADLVDAGFEIAYTDGGEFYFYDIDNPNTTLSGYAYDDEVVLVKGEDIVGIMCLVNVVEDEVHALDTVFGGIEMLAYDGMAIEVLINGVSVYGMTAADAAKELGFEYEEGDTHCDKEFVQGGVDTEYTLIQYDGDVIDGISISCDIDAL